MRKDFKKHNEEFVCGKCGVANPKLAVGERNHCMKCLYSFHVDEETPGDRKSPCKSLMEPSGLDFRGAKGFMIIHRCIRCGKIMKNKVAEDDNVADLSRFT